MYAAAMPAEPLPDPQGASTSADAVTAKASSAEVSPIYPGSHPYLHRDVKADMGPQPLSSPQKFELAIHSAVWPSSYVGNFVSAGYSHLTDSRPHYGTDRGGFGERLGAAKLKQVSENFLSYGFFASLFREDPHYYVMGPSHSFKSRVIYAPTRVFITRKDSGGSGVNWAKLAGIASTNALVNLYYPDRDQGLRVSFEAFGTNVATTAALMEIDEFLPDLVRAVRHKKKQ